ncbi:MAG TPA: FHA domain-containing protein [Capsulimonadaceae bacterium]|jgi:hypothetical protein
MAWKLKRSKTGEDEPKTKGLKPGDEDDNSDFEHKPGAFEPVANDYDSELATQDRTVMLLSDEDFLPGLIPGMPAAPAEAEAAEEPASEATADEDDFLASALSSADDAVSNLQAAKGTDEPEAAKPEDATGEFDLDAFAPYQPAANGTQPTLAPEPEAPVVEPVRPAVAETLGSSLVAARLVVRLGQFSASYEVTKAEVTIGRPDPRIDVFPDVAIEWDDAVSRNHARVLHRADGDYVEDTGSTNGTKLNGKVLSANKPLILTDGDKIQLGEKTEITYVH